MNAKFTPGPWSVEDPMGPETLSIVAHADKPTYEWQILASVHCDDEEDGETKYPLSPEVCAANARLIAAAPDLLESCKPAELRQAAILLRASGMDDAATALEKIAAKQDAAITRATTGEA